MHVKMVQEDSCKQRKYSPEGVLQFAVTLEGLLKKQTLYEKQNWVRK